MVAPRSYIPLPHHLRGHIIRELNPPGVNSCFPKYTLYRLGSSFPSVRVFRLNYNLYTYPLCCQVLQRSVIPKSAVRHRTEVDSVEVTIHFRYYESVLDYLHTKTVGYGSP